jgi:predicted acetyltransferase
MEVQRKDERVQKWVNESKFVYAMTKNGLNGKVGLRLRSETTKAKCVNHTGYRVASGEGNGNS